MEKKKQVKQPVKKIVAPKALKPVYYLFFLGVIISVVSIIRYRLISVPFERDEGEYAYIGNLFLHGLAPYKYAYTMKFPGTPFMYSILMLIFGHTNTGVHTGMIFINAATMCFLFLAFKKIFNPFIGLATASVYGFMAIGLVFYAFAAHATHFICFYSAIALFFLAGFIKSGKNLQIFLYGLMLGMAFLMKQQAVFLIFLGALFLLLYLKTWKKQNNLDTVKIVLIFGSGAIIPYAIVILVVALTGQFNSFWLWTVKYASKYEAVNSINMIVQQFKIGFSAAWTMYYYIWLLALGGILIIFINSYSRWQKTLVLTYFLGSLGAVSAGFYFRPHYFIVLLPAVGLLAGIFIEFVTQQIHQRVTAMKSLNISVIILFIFLIITVYVNRQYYFNFPPQTVCRLAYSGDFNEAKEISKYIHDHTNDTDKIAVLGSEPEIYFYADRTAATGYLYTYPLVENQPYNKLMQEQMIKEIEKNKPAYIVYCRFGYSWMVQNGAPQTIFQWADKYPREHYTPVGVADFLSNQEWQFYWEDALKNSDNSSGSFILILKRNPG